MPASKRIIVSISEMLLSEVDSFTVLEKRNRSEIVRDAIKFYLEERKKELMIEQMKKGYMEMAPINLTIASESSSLEEEILVCCESKLLE
ncbi:MAG: ribbon-helix-helix protein, CopG family [Syntrophomonas sp.]|nr:ribbon-helix-helix protein, CopG family [Syntrophomonas sp.]